MSYPLLPGKGDEDEEARARRQEAEEELADFCQAVKLDEISFEQWQAHHTDLDICLPLFLTEEEAFHGVVKEIKWTKATSADPGVTSHKPSRLRMARLVTIEPRTAHGTRLMIPDEGDQAHGKTGHLVVTVSIKPARK